MNEALNELGEMVFNALYDKTSQQEKIMLYITSLNKSSIERKEIISLCKKYDLEKRFKFKFPENVISTLLYRLVSKNMLIKTDKSGYSLPDRFFKEYVIKIKGYNGKGGAL